MQKSIIVIVALFCSLSLAIPSKSQQSPQEKQWQDLKNSYSWARVILNFAELRNQAGGPLDDLAAAIQDLVEDLNNKSSRATDDFEQRTQEHDETVQNLNDKIDSANLDISQTTEFLENVLYVQKENLMQTIKELERNIAKTQEYMENEKVERQKAHQNFLTRQAEHQDAIQAIGECLELLEQLEGNGLSLAQMSSAKLSFERVQKKLGKDSNSALVEALMSLSTSEFADSQALEKVVQLLVDVRNNLVAGQSKDQEDEQKAQEEFVQDIKNKTNEINKMIVEKTDASAQLQRTLEIIVQNEQFVKDRKEDLEGFQEDLQEENDSYQTATNIYNELVAQINKELSSCEDALNLLENAGFAGYISDRTAQDVVIDQPHGTGIQAFFF